ncbi:MAG: hypothetical protein O2807_09520, partial [bacterium]|nr:hypothetical protein [bacterium]
MTPEAAVPWSSEKNGAPPKAPPGERYVQVALNVPRLPPLTYKVPAEMAEGIAPGVRVFVPLGKRRVTGYVVSRPWSEPPPGTEGFAIKEIIERLDEEVLLTEELLGLTGWVADYYDCGWGEAIRTALPGVPEKKSAVRYRLTPAGREAEKSLTAESLPGLAPPGD